VLACQIWGTWEVSPTFSRPFSAVLAAELALVEVVAPAAAVLAKVTIYD
jgi:hypothetical protein